MSCPSSLWASTQSLPSFPPLEGDLKTDVLLVGGGIAGLLCAHRLRQEGVDCALVEARKICSGVTQNTTAKVTAQHGFLYHKLLKRFGPERARLYYDANQQALERLKALALALDCDWEDRDNYVYTLDDPAKAARELAAIRRLGIPAEWADRLPLPFPVKGAIRFPGQGQFHPLKFLAKVAKGLPIYEGTAVRELAPHRAVTPKGKIIAQNIVICTHFPLLNKHGGYFLKLYQHRSYVLALQNAPKLEGMYVDESGSGLSFRNYRDLLLLGGGGHRVGKASTGWKPLEQLALRYWPQASAAAKWAAQDCMTLDQVPYIGRYSKGSEGLWVATGFNKWGMTSSMAAADLLADLLLGRKNDFEPLFSPSRRILHPQLAVNGWESLVGLLTPTAPRCPHMGCALKWNRAERSWDCPCHGSRFSGEGGLLDGPATGDLGRGI